jgi:hypothetical protein
MRQVRDGFERVRNPAGVGLRELLFVESDSAGVNRRGDDVEEVVRAGRRRHREMKRHETIARRPGRQDFAWLRAAVGSHDLTKGIDTLQFGIDGKRLCVRETGQCNQSR